MTNSYNPGILWRQRLRLKLAQPRRTCELWLSRHCVIVAWLGILLALISPPHGSGIRVCWQQSVTGLSCLGCGLTRSLSCGIRGMFIQSWHYHPMGTVILTLFVFTAAQSLLPGPLRAQLKAYLQARAAVFYLLYVFFVTVFVAYGFTRALIQFASS